MATTEMPAFSSAAPSRLHEWRIQAVSVYLMSLGAASYCCHVIITFLKKYDHLGYKAGKHITPPLRQIS